MRYGFTEDGKLATYSDLDKIFSPEKCLDLPAPQNRRYNVEFGDTTKAVEMGVFNHNIIYFESGKGGIDLLRRILETNVEEPSEAINVVINPSLFLEESWAQDLYEGTQLTSAEIQASIEDWLNIHERTKRSGSVKETALRNVVVRGILNVVLDASTQFNLQIPIAMDEQRNAADKSTMSADEQVLTADCPSAKVLMQGQNMVGRDVIGIGAASLKGYFAASTYFNTNAAAIANLLKRKNNSLPNQEIDSTIFSHIIANVFNGKFHKKGLITLGNVNYKDAIEQLGMVETIHLTAEDLAKITDVNNKILAYIENSNLNIRQLLFDLDAAANGSWSSPIDSSFSLSGLISAATDFFVTYWYSII